MTTRHIFVFGSNLAGRHGKGAALCAVREHSAVYGNGIGPQGNAYAIPTKDRKLRPLPLERIRGYVREFVAYARAHPELTFEVTRVGCGLAGYTDSEIAPMFTGHPPNCELAPTWRFLLFAQAVGSPPVSLLATRDNRYWALEIIDDAVDRWHETNPPVEIHEYLGMSEAEYGLFVTAPHSLDRKRLDELAGYLLSR